MTASRRRPWLLATSCPGRRSGSTPSPPQRWSRGARPSWLRQREELARGPTGRLGVEVGPRSTHASRGAGVRGWRPALSLGESRPGFTAATRRPAKASGDAAAEIKGRCRQ
eukprot:scaffold16939_cov71-Phaeocystis_antarctica.AAC.5